MRERGYNAYAGPAIGGYLKPLRPNVQEKNADCFCLLHPNNENSRLVVLISRIGCGVAEGFAGSGCFPQEA